MLNFGAKNIYCDQSSPSKEMPGLLNLLIYIVYKVFLFFFCIDIQVEDTSPKDDGDSKHSKESFRDSSGQFFISEINKLLSQTNWWVFILDVLDILLSKFVGKGCLRGGKECLQRFSTQVPSQRMRITAFTTWPLMANVHPCKAMFPFGLLPYWCSTRSL